MILHVRHSSGVIRCCGVPSVGDAVGWDIAVVLNGLADGGKTYGTDPLDFEPNRDRRRQHALAPFLVRISRSLTIPLSILDRQRATALANVVFL